MKAVAQGFEFAPQLGVVVDFAIEDQHGIAIVAGHGLIPMFEIDDFEPDSAERYVGRLPNVLTVRAAVNQRAGNPPNPLGLWRFIGMRESGDAAHGIGVRLPTVPGKRRTPRVAGTVLRLTEGVCASTGSAIGADPCPRRYRSRCREDT